MGTISTAEEGLVPPIPKEWLDCLYPQQFTDINYLDAPFAGPAVSDDNFFGDDAMNPGSDDIVCTPGGGASDSTMFLLGDLMESTATSSSNTTTMAATPTAAASHNNNVVDLSPKAGIAKQVKKRSRASRRTPATLLNASIKDFSKLVQKYTGCQSSNMGSCRNGKGPITLSFGPPSGHRNGFPVSLGSSYYSNQHQVDHHYM
ncbi:OLC1v1025472C1 [Oldenlandia corymbosa var. corymbosa]|uniref:OLC1v1025472C1 n=1 Tax=Oldenlandia corymbosa var. corymbosa TaxID=529605 RepID=A0AAV1C4Z2_OLDCO|nr:OLC1v1025472C1 [Oldenlandia corymbosa var. corymbosa]